MTFSILCLPASKWDALLFANPFPDPIFDHCRTAQSSPQCLVAIARANKHWAVLQRHPNFPMFRADRGFSPKHAPSLSGIATFQWRVIGPWNFDVLEKEKFVVLTFWLGILVWMIDAVGGKMEFCWISGRSLTERPLKISINLNWCVCFPTWRTHCGKTSISIAESVGEAVSRTVVRNSGRTKSSLHCLN